MLRTSKRGAENILMNNILEIILVVILLIIIFVAVPRLFSTWFGKTKELQAKGTLDGIIQVLNSLEEGETENYFLLAPSNWHLVSFDSAHDQNRDGFKKPQQYFGQTVLCVCENKDCKICQTIKMPLKQGIELADIRIRILNLWLSNQKDYYNASEKPSAALYEMKEEEKAELSAVSQRITQEGYDKFICEASTKYYSTVNKYFANEAEFRSLIKAMILQESQGNHLAISSCGAVGLMQLMPLTAKGFNLKVYGLNASDECPYKSTAGKECDETYGICMKQFIQGKTSEFLVTIDERFDAQKNVLYGTNHIANLIVSLDSLEFGIAAFYAGSGVKQKCGFQDTIFYCTNYTSKPTPDQYVAEVMAKKRLIENTVKC